MTRAKRTSEPAATGRVFGYCRVSTERQSNEGHSLSDQESRIRGYAQSVGLSVSETFVEAGVSGGKRLAQRPKRAQLLARVQPGDHIIATKLDRMFRSACDALNVVEECRAKGIRLHLLDIGGEVTGNGVAKLVFSVLAAVAEMEKSRIGERVRSVKQHLRESGYFTGGVVPRGFKLTTDGKLVEDARWRDALAAMRVMRGTGAVQGDRRARVQGVRARPRPHDGVSRAQRQAADGLRLAPEAPPRHVLERDFSSAAMVEFRRVGPRARQPLIAAL